MGINLIAAVGISILLTAAAVFYALKTRTVVRTYEKRFSNVIDADKELEAVKQERKDLDATITELRRGYKEKKTIFDQLVREAAIYDEEIEMAELGFYKPHFDFDASEKYKEEVDRVRKQQKTMISGRTAVVCEIEWTVEGSKAEGRKMTNHGIRLTARSFNNECDAAISSTTWNNAERMGQRIEKAFDAINKLNESNLIEISRSYLNLKQKELQLNHEYREKKKQEKEKQSEARRQIREEAKLKQEVDKALGDEKKYEKLLEKAKKEAANATDEQLRELQEKIDSLSKGLASAHEVSERAMSMAQQTRAGHVYVISNIGSFGEGIFKIGMTRRLDPIDRVKELGDASVPFVFDIHALIYSQDAPALENALHRSFEERRLNLVNSRKEFFQVNLEQIEEEVRKLFPEAEFVKMGEAQEFRETKALRLRKSGQSSVAGIAAKYPSEI